MPPSPSHTHSVNLIGTQWDMCEERRRQSPLSIHRREPALPIGEKIFGRAGIIVGPWVVGLSQTQETERFSDGRRQWGQRREIRKPGGDYKDEC